MPLALSELLRVGKDICLLFPLLTVLREPQVRLIQELFLVFERQDAVLSRDVLVLALLVDDDLLDLLQFVQTQVSHTALLEDRR